MNHRKVKVKDGRIFVVVFEYELGCANIGDIYESQNGNLTKTYSPDLDGIFEPAPDSLIEELERLIARGEGEVVHYRKTDGILWTTGI